jgi:predicted transcriptional regulator
MSTTSLKLDAMIRFRAESELKKKLEKIAPAKRKKFPEFMREELWRIVEREESGAKNKKAKR